MTSEEKGEGRRAFEQKCDGSIAAAGKLEVRLMEGVQSTVTLATQVLDFSGIRGEERRFAPEMIGRGDQEAERTTILLLAMHDEAAGKMALSYARTGGPNSSCGYCLSNSLSLIK